MSWRDAPSLLVSAVSAGQALTLMRRELGEEKLEDLEGFSALEVDNFLVVRRCGKVRVELQPLSFRFCPRSSRRLFLVRQQSVPFEEAVVLVEQLLELPPLVLWHFGLLEEEECEDEELVRMAWERVHDQFALLEIDTEGTGVVLRYEYCRCSREAGAVCHVGVE